MGVFIALFCENSLFCHFLPKNGKILPFFAKKQKKGGSGPRVVESLSWVLLLLGPPEGVCLATEPLSGRPFSGKSAEIAPPGPGPRKSRFLAFFGLFCPFLSFFGLFRQKTAKKRWKMVRFSGCLFYRQNDKKAPFSAKPPSSRESGWHSAVRGVKSGNPGGTPPCGG